MYNMLISTLPSRSFAQFYHWRPLPSKCTVFDIVGPRSHVKLTGTFPKSAFGRCIPRSALRCCRRLHALGHLPTYAGPCAASGRLLHLVRPLVVHLARLPACAWLPRRLRPSQLRHSALLHHVAQNEDPMVHGTTINGARGQSWAAMVVGVG